MFLERDRLGNALENLTQKEQCDRQAMLTKEAMKAKNWPTQLDRLDVFKSSKKLKSLIREGGIPLTWRRHAWLELSGGLALKRELGSGYFASLSSHSPLPKIAFADIEADILRYFAGHQYLATPFGLQAVASVVGAHFRRTGRLQHNLNCIAAFLVSALGLGFEEDAFYIMVGLVDHVLPASCTQEEVKGGTVEQCVLAELMRKRQARLMALFAHMDYSLAELTSSWFNSLFVCTLPAETTMRVWDCLMCEGPKVLFRVAIAAIKKHEGALLQNVQMLRTLKWRISRTYNADELLKIAFNGIGSLPMAVITRSRQQAEAIVEGEREAQHRRLEALLWRGKLSPHASTSSAGSSGDLGAILEVPEEGVEETDDAHAFQRSLRPIRLF
jgi:hypothetical protein